MPDAVSDGWADQAEEVRQHLVALRGGAPFLSSDDLGLLVAWLEAGVSVTEILDALDQVLLRRRKKRSRLPLRLRDAKRHLEKARARKRSANPAPATAAHPLADLGEALRGSAHPESEHLHALADDLVRLEAADRDRLGRAALGCVRDFLVNRWAALPADELERRLTRAREELAFLAGESAEDELEALCEEVARDTLRAEFPLLSVSNLLAQVRA